MTMVESETVALVALVERARQSLATPIERATKTELMAVATEVTEGEDFDLYEAVLEALEVAGRNVTYIHDAVKKVGAPTDDDVIKELTRLRIRDQAWRRFQTEQHPPAVLPIIRTLRDRLQDPPPDVEWRVEGWQPTNTRVMLAAQFKAGKTTLTGNLARCLVDGDWWLDTAPVTKVNGGHVSIVDFEMSERQIDGWLADQKIIHDDQVLIIPLRGAGSSFNIIDETTRARWVEQLAGTEYLIVDCLRPILDALGLDEHKDGGRFLTAFDALCTQAGIRDSLIVHHMGHTGERSRGDSRFRDWPDVEWRLVRETDEPGSSRYISAYGRDVDIIESQLSYDPSTRHLRVTGGNRTNAAARRALDDVLAYLDSAGQVSKKELESTMVTETEHQRKAVRTAVGIGVHDGQILLEIGAHGKHLLTRQIAARHSSPGELANWSSQLASSYRAGEHDDPPGDHHSTGQLATPEEDPW